MTKKNESRPKDHIDDMLEEEERQEHEADIEEADELETLSKKLKEAEEKLLRQAADNENYLKRVMRETDDKIKYANQSLITKFLPVLDNFDLSLQHGCASSVETLMEGVRLTQKVMLDILSKSGLTHIDAKVGDAFDPNMHEAIGLACNPDLPNNSIASVMQNGYMLENRIIRPAKVQVNKLG